VEKEKEKEKKNRKGKKIKSRYLTFFFAIICHIKFFF
jgi:hypothetical protein